jgi:hypothetical protein
VIYLIQYDIIPGNKKLSGDHVKEDVEIIEWKGRQQYLLTSSRSICGRNKQAQEILKPVAKDNNSVKTGKYYCEN